MKFTLKKTDHLHKFQLANKISRIKLTTNENKTINGDSLIFHVKNEKLIITTSNGISCCYFELCEFSDDFVNFAVDSNQFTNAFSNFPSDEVQFAFLSEENQLVFGNKKTRVSLKTSSINEKICFENFSKIEEWQDLDDKNLIDSIIYTSFSCAPEYDEYPYTSILLFQTKKFNSQSSDKHRISIFGDPYENQLSYLLSKTNADLLLNFLRISDTKQYHINQGHLFVKWCDGGFYTSLEKNTYQSVFQNFSKFFSESELITSFTIDKNIVMKSLKFIQSITSTNSFLLKTHENQITLMSANNEKGTVADKILLDESIESINVEYVIGHFMKIFEIFTDDIITVSFYDYNGYTISILQSNTYKHLIFPMG